MSESGTNLQILPYASPDVAKRAIAWRNIIAIVAAPTAIFLTGFLFYDSMYVADQWVSGSFGCGTPRFYAAGEAYFTFPVVVILQWGLVFIARPIRTCFRIIRTCAVISTLMNVIMLMLVNNILIQFCYLIWKH